MFKDQECHKTLSNHSLILEKQVYFSFLGGAPTVGTPPLLLCTIKKIYRDSHLKAPKSSVYFKFSREKKGERYVKHFDAYQHLVVMLYAVSAHLQAQRANTSFVGKSRATCRKKNNNCWSDSSDHDLGRDKENASIPRKYGSIEWGEKTTIYPFLKLSKNFILRARATDIFSSGISPSKTNMVFTLLCSTLTDCSAFNIALYFTHW